MRTASRPLSAGWVAVSVRARNMLVRRLGREHARSLAASPSLETALARLAGTAYGREVQPGMDLAAAQRAIAAATLWHLRVLAGWAPPRAAEPVRALAAWFELANIEDRLDYVAGATPPPPFALGAMATVWPNLAGAQSAAEIRVALAGSPWGDPGEDVSMIRLHLRLAWASRVIASVEEAADWAAGAIALLLARELVLADRPPGDLAEARPPGVGTRWVEATSVDGLRARLPRSASWPLRGVEEPADLWRAEAAWWRGVEEDAEGMARDPHMGRGGVVGCVALLCVDAWRTGAALESAARAGGRAYDVYSEIA